MLSGRYDFEDGGYYCGQYTDGLIEGHGVCVSPNGQGEFSGKWQKGFEISGVYKWPSGNKYEGCWAENRKHGLGFETKDKWIFKGEWSRGLIGRYGCKYSLTSAASYEGTWSAGLVDGYGVEVSVDGGIYRGQWFKGMRHGHGVRVSVPFDQAAQHRNVKCKTFQENLKSSFSSINSEGTKLDRGGFVLRGLTSRPALDSDSMNSPQSSRKYIFQKNIANNFKRSLVKTFGKYKNPGKEDSKYSRSLPQSASGSPVRFTSGSVRSLISADSNKSTLTDRTESEASFSTDGNIIETYSGEWKSDKRCGYGIGLRTDGLKYAGEWYNNKKNGYGMTTSEDGYVEEGKYRNNVLVTALTNRKASIFAIRSARLRDQVNSAVAEAEKASQIAFQKTEVAVNRMNVAKAKAEQASLAALKARKDSEKAFQVAKKSWDIIIKDTDLIDSIQLRNSKAENRYNLASKEPLGNHLLKHVLNSSLRKSLRLSQRSNKNSDKSSESQVEETRNHSEETHKPSEGTPNFAEETEKLSAEVLTSGWPQDNLSDSQPPNRLHDSVNTEVQYLTAPFEPYDLKQQRGTFIRTPTRTNKISPAPQHPLDKLTSIPSPKSDPATTKLCSTPKTSKRNENCSWCLLTLFNASLALVILFLLHQILI